MPLFYLHICNGNGFTEDEEGADYADLAAAREAAIMGLRDIMAGELRSGQLNTASFIEIEDESHELAVTVPFADAVNVSNVAASRPSEAGS
jgi:hypothetical protein